MARRRVVRGSLEQAVVTGSTLVRRGAVQLRALFHCRAVRSDVGQHGVLCCATGPCRVTSPRLQAAASLVLRLRVAPGTPSATPSPGQESGFPVKIRC